MKKNKLPENNQHASPSLKKSPNTRQLAHTSQSIRIAPLPDPFELTEYERIKPGSAERIFVMAENQSTHRQELEQKKLEAEIKHLERRDGEAKLGQIFAFIIVLSTIFCGLYAAIHGEQIFAAITVAMGISSIAYIFVKGREK